MMLSTLRFLPQNKRVLHSHILPRVTTRIIPNIYYCTINTFMTAGSEMGRNVEKKNIDFHRYFYSSQD